MKQDMKLSILSIFLFSLVFLACEKDYLVDKKNNIANEKWTYRDSLNFDFEIKDTLKIYNLYLEIEHGESYPFQNLYVMTHTKFPNGIRAAQRLNVDLAEKTGKWQGEKSGNKWTHRVDLQQGAYFSQSGKYCLTLAQFMRHDSLPELNSVRFIVEETAQNRSETANKKEKAPNKDAQKKYLIK
jgi:gliding motility-associated lipoprotein GldH